MPLISLTESTAMAAASCILNKQSEKGKVDWKGKLEDQILQIY